ncbi:hypothetical protein KDA11_01255, partial [Candidatus Saccharibacteria bacterium]|nr:hypothetical protein [Candidatus Saccharibacteria bacterium]
MTQHNSFSPKNREDDLLKSALANIDEVQNSQGESTTNYVTGGVLKSKISKLKKTLIIALVLVISSLAIGFGYWLLQKDKNTQSSNQNNSDQQNSKKVSEQTVKLGFDPDLVAYLHRDNQADPNQLFYRPANGGERKDVLKLQNDESAVVSDVYGQIVVLASESKLYLSNDGGRNYNVIYTHDTSDSIISAKISTDLSKIAFSTIPSIEGVAGSSYYGTIYSINIKGEDKKQLIQSSDKALLLLGWDSKQNKIAYSEGCYNCDGSRTAYKLYSINSTNTEGILTDKDLATVQYLQISRDLSKVIYVTSSSPTSFE